MIDRTQVARQEVAGQVIGIGLVRLVAASALAPTVAHDDAPNDRLQQVVQPLRLRTFLEGDVDGAAHAPEELHERRGLGGQNRAHDHASAPFTDRGDGRGLVYIESDMLTRPLHEGRPLVWSTECR